jgi:drug/metabolite transporter (DMT)-like permease
MRGVILHTHQRGGTMPNPRGYTIAVASAVILSTTAIFIRYLTENFDMPPLVLALWRDIFVTITLVVVLGRVRPALLRVGPGHARYLAMYGFVLAIFNALWTLSVARNGAAVATVLVYSSTAFTVLLGWWVLDERLDWAKGLAVVMCIGGCALVSEAVQPGAWQSNVLGIVTGVLSGLSYAVYSLMGRSASQRGLNPWTTLLYTFGIAAVCLLGFNALPERILPGTASEVADLWWLGDALKGWGVLILLAAGPTVLGFGLYNLSLKALPSSIANLIVSLEPASTAVIAYLLLGERLSMMQILGSLVLLGGVVFLRVYEGRIVSLARLRAREAADAVAID